MFEDLEQRLVVFEGDVPCMYLDTMGNVTCGVGHLLANVQAAYGLPFLLPSGLPAEQHDILNDFQAIKQSESGRAVGYYMQIADLRLRPEDRHALLKADIQSKYDALFAALSALPYFPRPAQNALLNMAFQLGVRKLILGYPRLIAACHSGHWQNAADECGIVGAQPARNAANREWFLAARS